MTHSWFFFKTWCTGSRNIVLITWGVVNLDFPEKSLRGLLLLYLFNPKSLLSWGVTLAFPFPYCRSSSIRLYSLIQSINWCTLLTDFLAKDFLKSCLAGRPTLNVLIATSSKSLLISLNISQYLSEYVSKVSHSRMDIDNRESKGQETLLHMIKRDPNTRVSSLKESMEPTPRPLNHLIATGPKLEGNTLHIKASFLECTAILWLKWLSSTGFVQPLYMVNVGWVNCQGSLPPSILHVKGDLEIWLSTLLIASFP